MQTISANKRAQLQQPENTGITPYDEASYLTKKIAQRQAQSQQDND